MRNKTKAFIPRILAACFSLFFLSHALPGSWRSACAIITALRGDMPEGTIEIPEGWIKTADVYEMQPREKRSLYYGKNNGEHIAVLVPKGSEQDIHFAARAKEFDESYSKKAGVPSKAYMGGSSVLSLYSLNLVLGVALTLLSICVLAAFFSSPRPPPDRGSGDAKSLVRVQTTL